MRSAILVLSFVLLAATAHAQYLPTAGERRAADIASWVSAGAVIGMDVAASWNCTDRVHCFQRQAIRVGVVYGAVFAAKLVVRQPRPCASLEEGCGSDNPNFSFFSGHAGVAFSTLGGPRLDVALPLSTWTAIARVLAGKHRPVDVLVGAGVGALASRIR